MPTYTTIDFTRQTEVWLLILIVMFAVCLWTIYTLGRGCLARKDKRGPEEKSCETHQTWNFLRKPRETDHTYGQYSTVLIFVHSSSNPWAPLPLYLYKTPTSTYSIIRCPPETQEQTVPIYLSKGPIYGDREPPLPSQFKYTSNSSDKELALFCAQRLLHLKIVFYSQTVHASRVKRFMYVKYYVCTCIECSLY